jgi:predicted nucleotidyltransferase
LTQQGGWCLKAPHRYVETGLNREISSTIARTAIAQGEWEKAATVIPVKVLELIRTRGWYSAREAAGTGSAHRRICGAIQPITVTT